MLAATVRVTGDLDLAEECVQDAYAQALTRWPADGVPSRPGGWLTTVARRRAIDVVRRESTLRRLLPQLVTDDRTTDDRTTDDRTTDDRSTDDSDTDDSSTDDHASVDRASDALRQFPDDRLKLICVCCHPALAPQAQVALTLRLVCGLTTAEVARAFLVGEATMAARITRAKKKIAAARIPYRTPSQEQLSQRLAPVLAVVHLLFTTGHSAPAGADLVRVDLTERALDLARMLRTLLPADPDVAGLLALLVITDARRCTRTDRHGALQPLSEQDRSRWDAAAISEGAALVREAIAARPPGRYALEAAIAAVHAEAPSYDDTDWHEIVGLYDVLLRLWPSPVVALNRAVADGLANGAERGLAGLDQLAAEPQLNRYGYLPAARAYFLRQSGLPEQAKLAYAEAIELTENAVEQGYLRRQLAELES